MSSSRALHRRGFLRAVGLAAAAPLLPSGGVFGLPGYHPLVPAQTSEKGTWRPRFLEPEEVDAVEILAELIVPETDTPGARSALVHQSIDWSLARADSEQQARFRAGLSWLNERCRERAARPFRDLTQPQQAEMLERMSSRNSAEPPIGYRFFDDLKARTIAGYYRSEPGMREELGYRGNARLSRFEGCQHPEHLEWRPGKDAGGDDSDEQR